MNCSTEKSKLVFKRHFRYLLDASVQVDDHVCWLLYFQAWIEFISISHISVLHLFVVQTYPKQQIVIKIPLLASLVDLLGCYSLQMRYHGANAADVLHNLHGKLQQDFAIVLAIIKHSLVHRNKTFCCHEGNRKKKKKKGFITPHLV